MQMKKNVSVAALSVAALLGSASALVRPYTFVPDRAPIGCDAPVLDLLALNRPCGMDAQSGVACPVMVHPGSATCGSMVKISTLQDAQGNSRAIYGQVVGEANVGEAAFGLSHNGFKTLCPFACLDESDNFVKCVELPTQCSDSQKVRVPKMDADMLMIPDFSSFGDQELAYAFESSTDIPPHRDSEMPTAVVHRTDASPKVYEETDVLNCLEDAPLYDPLDLRDGFCGTGGQLPCTLSVNAALANQCHVPGDDECHDITFYREGIEEMDRGNAKFCSGGLCPTMSTITRRFRVDATYDDPAAPLYGIPLGAWAAICPNVCGTKDIGTDGEWAWACVQWTNGCVGRATRDPWFEDFLDGKVRYPGSFVVQNLDVLDRKTVKCSSFNPNSGTALAVPAALSLAAAVVVSVVYGW